MKLVLLRHGQSVWNREDRFTGWTDVDLSPQGIEEARRAGQLLRAEGYRFDMAYTSVLKRAIRTLWIALDELDQMWIPVERSWRLNERHYGALQGSYKSETAARFGAAQVHLWRRSYETRPPAMTKSDPGYPGHDARYQGLNVSEWPLTESLQDTERRFLPYWETAIVPAIRQGKRILVVAHGNSLRALVKHLDHISDQDIADVSIPTGVPLVYELDDEVEAVRHCYLGQPSAPNEPGKA